MKTAYKITIFDKIIFNESKETNYIVFENTDLCKNYLKFLCDSVLNENKYNDLFNDIHKFLRCKFVVGIYDNIPHYFKYDFNIKENKRLLYDKIINTENLIKLEEIDNKNINNYYINANNIYTLKPNVKVIKECNEFNYFGKTYTKYFETEIEAENFYNLLKNNYKNDILIEVDKNIKEILNIIKIN